MESHKSKSFRPRTEMLEGRQMLAANNVLVLDFTPDAVPDGVRPSSFVSTFNNLRYSNGTAPSFLDFNGNRYIDNNDVALAAQQIANQTAAIFAKSLPSGYNVGVNVRYSDTFGDSNWGQRYLEWGRRAGQNNYVSVMYVGGYSFDRRANIIGVGCQAYSGQNLEHYAYAFTSSIGDYLMRNVPNATTADFVYQVAETIAHEAGHLMGLGHQYNHPQGGNSIMNYSSNPRTAYFTNEFYYAETYSRYGTSWQQQNPYHELWYSLTSQPHTSIATCRYQRNMTHEEMHANPSDSHDVSVDEVGISRGGRLYFDTNGNGQWDGLANGDRAHWFGAQFDTPVVGDFNGDGWDEIGIFRNGRFFLDQNGNGRWDGQGGGDRLVRFGGAGDKPVVGDWNGDGVDDVGVYRRGYFILDQDGNGHWDGIGTDGVYLFGSASDAPIAGDWNGDGTDEFGIFRDGTFYRDMNGNGSWDGFATDAAQYFGGRGDTPAIGDWNGDGRDDLGIYRRGVFYQDSNGNGRWNSGDNYFRFGAATDVPLVGNWRLTQPSATAAAVEIANTPTNQARASMILSARHSASPNQQTSEQRNTEHSSKFVDHDPPAYDAVTTSSNEGNDSTTGSATSSSAIESSERFVTKEGLDELEIELLLAEIL